MSFDFPTEVVKEGEVSVVVPKLEAFVKEPWEYAPSKAPVFYNPLMEFNRDVAVLALQAYQKMVKREISVCEPLAGCGIRGIRFAKEVEGVRKVVVNDINPEAAKLAEFNADRNKLAKRVSVVNGDANLLLAHYAAPRRRFDFIDVDPFGSPVPYMDSALRATRNGGLLALTATDLAPLCGVHSKACVRKYGGKPLRTGYSHELAVRLLAGCLVMMAAKHDIGVQIVFSHSTYNYARVYAITRYGARRADSSIQKMGYVLHCFSCFHRETSEGVISTSKRKCPVCGSNMSIAGPLWLGKLWIKEFCTSMRKLAEERKLKNQKRILKFLYLVENEVNAPATYYVIDKICDRLNLSVPSLAETIEALREAGFQATPTHFNSKAFRTNAPAEVVKETLIRLSSSRSSNSR
ncbi:MAG: tRNA (guanine(10)-N(2))-dimethyltransferase [Candidatus Bathyarchaeia archaeon]